MVHTESCKMFWDTLTKHRAVQSHKWSVYCFTSFAACRLPAVWLFKIFWYALALARHRTSQNCMRPVYLFTPIAAMNFSLQDGSERQGRAGANYSLKYQRLPARTNVLKFSFFPRTTPLWSTLPTSAALAPTLADEIQVGALQTLWTRSSSFTKAR